jgi:hypothetical protein
MTISCCTRNAYHVRPGQRPGRASAPRRQVGALEVAVGGHRDAGIVEAGSRKDVAEVRNLGNSARGRWCTFGDAPSSEARPGAVDLLVLARGGEGGAHTPLLTPAAISPLPSSSESAALTSAPITSL